MGDGGMLKKAEMDPNFDPEPGRKLVKRNRTMGFGR